MHNCKIFKGEEDGDEEEDDGDEKDDSDDEDVEENYDDDDDGDWAERDKKKKYSNLIIVITPFICTSSHSQTRPRGNLHTETTLLGYWMWSVICKQSLQFQ